MNMNQSILYACLTLFAFNLYATDHEQIISESAQIAQNITSLIIACKKTKDAKLITDIVKQLLLNTAQLTETIIEKRKQKKANKSISLHDFNFNDIATDPLENTINDILTLVHESLEYSLD